MSFFQGEGDLDRTKSFEALFFCPEAIKSKQMPMCQKVQNSGKVIFEIFCLRILEKVTQKFQKWEGGG